MNNTYIIKRKSLTEALDNISNFEDKINKFISKHKNIEYNIELDKDKEDNWIITINIKNRDEQSNTQVSEEVTKTRRIL